MSKMRVTWESVVLALILEFERVVEKTGQDLYSTQRDNGMHDHQSSQ